MVGTISSLNNPIASLTNIAIEYASSPDAQPALHILIILCPLFFFLSIIFGNTFFLNSSYTDLSRKKLVTLIVNAFNKALYSSGFLSKNLK